MITQERIKELLSYDAHSGKFYWRVNRGAAKIGRIAGCLNTKGYRKISVDGHTYLAHRLAWLYIMKVWPVLSVDHKNGDPDDNSFNNLRLASPAQNQHNKRKYTGSLPKGVAYYKNRTDKFQARIRYKGKQLHLGVFDCKEKAHSAYCKTAKELFGEFYTER